MLSIMTDLWFCISLAYILMQEAREEVELFRNYYLINYATFEQDMHNEDNVYMASILDQT